MTDIMQECERMRTELQTASDAMYQAQHQHWRDHPDHMDKITVVPGRVWIRIDIGTSGAFMVHGETGLVHGIKGYGTPHKKVVHGRIDQITGEELLPRRFTRANTPPIR